MFCYVLTKKVSLRMRSFVNGMFFPFCKQHKTHPKIQNSVVSGDSLVYYSVILMLRNNRCKGYILRL
jgi:hypothetical protein